MPPLRFQPPDRLLGATKFSEQEDLIGSLNCVQLLKGQRWVWEDLRRACDLDCRYGRRREPGHWELAAVAFVTSGHIDIQPWLASTTDEIWRACGFAAKPPYKRVWRRLRELEDVVDAFLDAVGAVVQHARRHDPRAAAHTHLDGTEDETHAALVHDCEPGRCPVRRRGHASGRGRAGVGQRPLREETRAVRDERQKLNALDPEVAEQRQHTHDPSRVPVLRRGSRLIKRVKIGACWYRTLDVDAGIRAYMGPRGAKRFWHGYYSQKLVCHFTGGTIFSGVYSASRQEYQLFDDVYDNARRIIGAPPQTIIGDKGYSVARVFEKCTRNGTAAIFPWRPAGGDHKRHDKETHDRHGVARCKHRGARRPSCASRPETCRGPRQSATRGCGCTA